MEDTAPVKEIKYSAFRKNFLKSIVILLLLFSIAYAENNHDENDIVSKIIDAYGGKDNLAKVISIAAEGHINNFFSNDEGTYFRYIKRDRKLYVNIKYSRTEEKRILNGDKGYRGSDGKVSEVKGPPYDAMVYQYNQLDLPYGFIIDNTFKVTYLRKDALNGIDVKVLKVSDKYGHDIEVYVSARAFFILKVVGSFGKGDNAMSLGAEFSDFNKVNGVLLPFKITNYADSTKISETKITKYTINPSVDESAYFSNH